MGARFTRSLGDSGPYVPWYGYFTEAEETLIAQGKRYQLD